MTDYRKLYESAPVGLWQTSIDEGQFLSANKEACDILGYDDFNDLSTVLATDLYDVTARKNLLKYLLKAKEVKDYPVTMTRKDGKEISVLLSAKIHPDKGYIEGTIRDVTEDISLESILAPHVQKMSILKQHIIQRLENTSNCEQYTSSKII